MSRERGCFPLWKTVREPLTCFFAHNIVVTFHLMGSRGVTGNTDISRAATYNNCIDFLCTKSRVEIGLLKGIAARFWVKSVLPAEWSSLVRHRQSLGFDREMRAVCIFIAVNTAGGSYDRSRSEKRRSTVSQYRG